MKCLDHCTGGGGGVGGWGFSLLTCPGLSPGNKVQLQRAYVPAYLPNLRLFNFCFIIVGHFGLSSGYFSPLYLYLPTTYLPTYLPAQSKAF